MRKFRTIIVLMFVLFLLVNCRKTEKETEPYYEWNGGRCVEDGGRLNYISVGSKYHYRCEICGKEYVFGGIQKYE